jgi:hypothetical protein
LVVGQVQLAGLGQARQRLSKLGEMSRAQRGPKKNSRNLYPQKHEIKNNAKFAGFGNIMKYHKIS